jgi:hypothetical protein
MANIKEGFNFRNNGKPSIDFFYYDMGEQEI